MAQQIKVTVYGIDQVPSGILPKVFSFPTANCMFSALDTLPTAYGGVNCYGKITYQTIGYNVIETVAALTTAAG